MEEPSYLSLRIVEKQLRSFNGNKERLSEFLSVNQAALNLVAPAERDMLFNLIKLKVEGKAYQNIKYRNFASFEELKIHLEEVFGEKRSQAQWELELHSCRQKISESVMEFAERLEDIMYKLIDCITSTVEEKFRKTHEDLIKTQTKNVFISGIKDSYSLILKARNPQTFEEAIAFAVAEEKEIKSKADIIKYYPSNGSRGQKMWSCSHS